MRLWYGRPDCARGTESLLRSLLVASFVAPEPRFAQLRCVFQSPALTADVASWHLGHLHNERGVERFLHVCDFGDSRRHDIFIEEIHDLDVAPNMVRDSAPWKA